MPRCYKLRPSPATHHLATRAKIAHMPGVLPPSVDLRSYFPGIRDQGQEGACTGFATAGFREVLWGMANNKLIPTRLSPAYLYARTRMAEGSFPADNGATMADEFAVLQGYGVCPEDELPYDQDPAESPTPLADAHAVPYRIGVPTMVHLVADSLKTVLAAGLPIGIAIPVYSSFENPTEAGDLPVPNTASEALLGGHGLLLLGYSDDRKAWLVANQWGVGWGDAGFCHLQFGYEAFFWEAWTSPLIA